jgi:hypothetical protein
MRHIKRTNLIVDIILLIVFLMVYEEKATGTAIHEWLGITLGIIFIVHIILHWKWLVCCSRQFLKRMKAESRINYLLDMLIFIGFTTIIFTGLMISESFLPTFGIKATRSHFWQEIHFASVDITLFLTALHFALHWKWMVVNFKRYIISPLKRKPQTDKIPVKAIIKKAPFFNFSKLVDISYQVIIILVLSGLISFGWYAASGNNIAETNNMEYRHRGGRHMESNLRRGDERRGERFGSGSGMGHNERGRHSESGHDRGGIFRTEILKNILIFSMVTLVVTLFGSAMKRIKYLQIR